MQRNPSYLFNNRQYWPIGKMGKILMLKKKRSNIDYTEIETWIDLTLPLYCLHSNGNLHFKNEDKICDAMFFEYLSLKDLSKQD